MKEKIQNFLLAAFLLIPFAASAIDVPEPLTPWVSWVLKGQEAQLCPFFNGDGRTLCRWSSPLVLSLEDQKGSFSVQAKVFEEGWIPLPGDADHWPQEVKAGGAPLAVVAQDGRPQVYAAKGAYPITGAFFWDALPESLAIPPDLGVVRLTLKGAAVQKVNRDEEGRLWLEAKPVAESERDRIDVRVHRLLTDDVPFAMTTRITLEVSGKTRDVTLPSPLPEGFIPLSLESPLPTQLEKDGRIKVQAKAGTWDIEFKARHHGPVAKIQMGLSEAPWPSEEIWAFEARNNLRLVNVTGIPPIDPTQTTLPDAWKSFPAYRILPGEMMVFEERRRGDSDPAPDQITLARDLWLDFDGGGYTLRDTISGTMVKGSRLETSGAIKLGHVSVNGKDQLITTLGEGKSGVEIRQGGVNVVAESRLNGGARSLPATGWEGVFQRVSEVLHLPPGWRALAVIGADSVPNTWLNRWTLLEIFLVVIAALSFSKLWGWKWGVTALIGLGLTATEDGAPLWAWIAVLVGLGLLRFLPEGKFRKLVKAYRVLSLLILIAIAVPFLVDQVRAGLYPSLEGTGVYPMAPATLSSRGFGGASQMAPEAVPPPPPAVMAPPMEIAQDEMALEEQGVQKQEVLPSKSMPRVMARKMNTPSQTLLTEYQPGAKVQTGPGLPHWTWRRIDINWSGPVEPGEKIRLLLIPPWVNLILSFLRVILVALLVVCVLDLPAERRPRFLRALSVLLVLLFTVPTVHVQDARAEFPTPDLLQDLKNRLLEKPECHPNCASVSRMRIEATPTSFTARLEIHVEAASAVPLPGVAKEWTPSDVMVGSGEIARGDKAALSRSKETKSGSAPAPSRSAALSRSEDGRLWIALEPGVHQVLLTGPLPDRQNVQIPLPLKPYYVEARAEGWSVLGLHEDGIADDNLQLVRTQASAETAPTRGEAGALPAFLTIERHLILGLTWEVETTLRRETPVGTAVVVPVPLLVGESVTTPGFRVEGGKVNVNLGPQAVETSWRSVLLESPTIPLKAEDATVWTEVWVVEAAPIWHLKMEGIPVVHHYDQGGEWLPTFRPWPGEEATLSVYRPEAVEGQTLTIDKSRFTLTPGFRSTESALWISLRSSLGAQHTVTLPEGAELQSVSLNGQVQPIRQVDGAVTLPVVPGAQTAELKWNQQEGIAPFFRAPEVGLGIPSVNAEVSISLPRRWVLFTGGPRLGPAVLFWGLVVVILLVSIGLGRVSLTPLKTHHWFLLGLGLTQVPVWSSIFVAAWLLALGWRRRKEVAGSFAFDLRQIFLAGLTVAALIVLVFSIERGLLGIPVMQIEGNGSTDSYLVWFQDRVGEVLPRPWVVTLPMYVYRGAMLAWAVWLALALLKWLKWGWESFSTGGLWKPLKGKIVQKEP